MISETRCRAIIKGRCEDESGQPWCEVRIHGVCLGKGTNYQHRKNRSQCAKYERWAPSNGLYVCGSGTTGCHGYIHAHPKESYANGWMVRQVYIQENIPVRLARWERPVFLDNEGGVEEATDAQLIGLLGLGYGYPPNSEDMGGVA
jgi:hypothetical protein